MTNIVVTADDFGLCEEINDAVCLLHDRGIVHRTSLLVNSDIFEASVDALRRRPALDIALHLNLTDGRPTSAAAGVPSLLNRVGGFHGDHCGVIARIVTGRMSRCEIHREWSAQIAKARAAGLNIRQLNGHGHLHLLPQLHGVVLDLLREFDIPDVRLVRSHDSPRGVLLHLLSLGLMYRLKRHGLRFVCPDRTLGLRHPGSVDRRIDLDIPGLREGALVELIVHPSSGDNADHRRWGYASNEVMNWLLIDVAQSLPRTANASSLADRRPQSHGDEMAVSVIVPTYREAGNVAELVRRVKAVATAERLALELLIVDDRSDDGTIDAVRSLGEGPWLVPVARAGARSLSGAVVEGLRRARGERCVVMDGDLSHPPEAIPQLLAALDQADFVIGSRYVEGGMTDTAWPPMRRWNSLLARVMARPLGIDVRDPGSGFFALRRNRFLAAADLRPIGYKIGLELLVKCGCRRIREVPIHFQQRRHGETKLGLRQRFEYVEHLRRLWWYRARARRRTSAR